MKIMTCKKEGCGEYCYHNHDLCWDHYKETQPAYADDIKKAISQWLEYEKFDKVVMERKLSGYGYGHSCFDVIAVKNIETLRSGFEIIGIEIKSDHDSYARLEEQLPNYFDLFDKVYLCLDGKKTPKHPLIGILRFEKGHIVIEKDPAFLNRNKSILCQSEMTGMLRCCGLHAGDAQNISQALDMIPNIRRKLIYNRFFGEFDHQNKKMHNGLVFNERELEFLIKIGVGTNLQYLSGRARSLKTAISGLIKLCEAVENLEKEESQKLIEQKKLLEDREVGSK